MWKPGKKGNNRIDGVIEKLGMAGAETQAGAEE